MNKSVYLDTTIPSFLFDRRESALFQRELTWKWWELEARNYVILISDYTIWELEAGHYPHKTQALKFVSALSVLPPAPETEEIANVYISHYVMPRDLQGDAMHLAYASFYKIDFLLTWNCSHLANGNKRQHIRRVNTMLNLGVPEILTFLELFAEEEP